MKIAMIRLGGRISTSGSAAGGNEALGIAQVLTLTRGVEVHCYTKLLAKEKNTINNQKIFFHDIEEEYQDSYEGYDCLIVMSGNVNFFGGKEDRPQILNYDIINKFKGQIFYFLVDTNLLLKQIWGSIQVKDWRDKYNKEDIYITRRDIILVSQFYDLVAVKNLLKGNITFKKIIYYPLALWIFNSFSMLYNPKKEIDLIYGGAFRPSRQNKLIKFYFGHSNIKTTIFGNFKLDKINSKLLINIPTNKYPVFEKSVSFNSFIQKISSSFSTCIIGDPWYEGRNISLRVYESILSGLITFVDKEFDPQKRIFGNNHILQNNYVSNRQQLENNILKLKKNPSLCEEIRNEQFKSTYKNSFDMSSELFYILKGVD